MHDIYVVALVILSQLPLYVFAFYLIRRVNVYEQILNTIFGINYITSLYQTISDMQNTATIQSQPQRTQRYKRKLLEFGVEIPPDHCITRAYYREVLRRQIIDIGTTIHSFGGDSITQPPDTLNDISEELVDMIFGGIAYVNIQNITASLMNTIVPIKK